MGILLVYDVTDEASFNNIRNWMRNIEQHASDNVNKVETLSHTAVTVLYRLARVAAAFEAVPEAHHGRFTCAGPCGEQV